MCVCFQLEELIKEVQVLRKELRSRDKTIAQLTLQCQQLQQQHQRKEMVSCCEQDLYKSEKGTVPYGEKYRNIYSVTIQVQKYIVPLPEV